MLSAEDVSYLQSFTNTYVPVREQAENRLNFADFSASSNPAAVRLAGAGDGGDMSHRCGFEGMTVICVTKPA